MKDMAKVARENGLAPSEPISHKLEALTDSKESFRVRYIVVDTAADIKARAILALAEEVREAARLLWGSPVRKSDNVFRDCSALRARHGVLG